MWEEPVFDRADFKEMQGKICEVFKIYFSIL